MCQASCTLLNGTAALWSALAQPDSANVPVDVAVATLAVSPGDSVIVRLVASSEVVAALVPAESLFVQWGTRVVGLSLADALGGAVVLRFAAAASVDLRYRLNRALPTVPAGELTLTQETSAAMLALRADWVAPHPPAVLRDVLTAPCESEISVTHNDRLCETDVRVIPAVPADAFLANGATFQSDPGHGQSHQIVIDFSSPVQAVEITAYDPTWDGNTMIATDAQGTVVGQYAFVANHRPGVFSQDRYRATGSISRVILTPPVGEYIAYSMKVLFNTVDPQPITLTPSRTGLLSPYVPSIVEPLQCNVTEQRFHRDYTVTVQRRTATGLVPVANQDVDLSLAAITGTGGHLHTVGRPIGTFRFGSDSIMSTTVTTGADGRATFAYFPPEQGGMVVLTARSTGSRSKVDTVRVGLALQELMMTSHMLDTGKTRFHTDNHWMTATMAGALTALADSVYDKFGVQLGINDESLPLGGQFDISGQWTKPHCSHRNGRGADVQTEGHPPAYRRFIEAKWAHAFGNDAVHPESNHPHLKTPQ